jgi:hypothetical protein
MTQAVIHPGYDIAKILQRGIDHPGRQQLLGLGPGRGEQQSQEKKSVDEDFAKHGSLL